jgi:hypothetical protein
MNLIFRRILIVFFLFSKSIIFAQSPEEMVVKDYPKLYNDFKSEVGGQKARYVFAIDVSSSMKQHELTVKTNIKNFINALPDGDFVSVVQKASTPETRLIVSNQPVNSSTRKRILDYIEGLSFNKIGSDGFTMTDEIITSINQTGSSDDMKYVFMFTDFEYWTIENPYNKKAVSWASLGDKIKGRDGFLRVYGLELYEKGVGVVKEAVYKQELEQIFGKVEYVSGGDNSSILNTWFINTKANILNDRLQYVLKRKTEKQNAALILSASGLGKDLSIKLKSDKMSSVYTTAELEVASLAEVKNVSESRPWIGAYEPQSVTLTVKARLRSPKYFNEKKSTPTDPYNEVDKLLNPQFEEFKIEVYQGKPYLPWYIGWPLVALLVFWILSIIYHLITYKADKRWNLSASLRNAPLNNVNGNELKSFDPKSIKSVPFECGQGAKDYSIEECGFKFSIGSKRNILCIPFFKRGYYITKISGGEMAFVKNRKEQKVSTGESIWIGSPKAAPVGQVQIKKGSDQYVIVKIL